MFKNLKDRLRSASKKMEENLEFTPADDLDAELAAELEAELAKELGSSTAPTPAGEEAPSPAAAADVVDDAPEVEASPAATSPEAGEEVQPATPETAPIPDVSARPETPAPEPDAELKPEPSPEPAAKPAVAPATVPTQQPKPVDPPKKPVPNPGRKVLSQDEIQARIDRELLGAVETQKAVQDAVGPSVGRFTINEDVLEEVLWELEIGLLESDVALPVIEAIKNDVKDQLLSLRVGGRSAEEVVEKVLRSAVRRVLDVQSKDFDAFVRERMTTKKPVVVMFVGVNGTGKTTSIGRIAYRLQKQGITSVMAAGDTFRAGAIEQLQQHGDNLGIKVIRHNAGADPAAVAYDAVEHARARNKDVVLLDTAGRMQTNTNLMAEMDKIRRVANPDLVVFVGDSLAGNDAVEQARKFDEVVDIDGVILTKTDVDAKGGAALSVAYTINKPLLFIGVGQDYPDLEPFNAQRMVARLFDGEDYRPRA